MNARLVALLAWTALAVGALGAVPLAKKLALDAGASAPAAALTMAWIAAALVIGWTAIGGKLPALARADGRSRVAVLTVGALGSGLVPLMGLAALTQTTASNRALFQSAYPAATAIAAWLLLGERLRASTAVLIVLVCAGLALVNVDPSAGGPGFGWPFWLLLGTLPLIGLADVIAKHSLGDQPPEVVAAGRALGGALVLLLVLPWVAAPAPAAWLPILAAGAGMGVFAIALYQVFDRTRASIAASLIALAPLLTLAGEAWLLGVSLSGLQWIGFAVVLAAVLGLARRA